MPPHWTITEDGPEANRRASRDDGFRVTAVDDRRTGRTLWDIYFRKSSKVSLDVRWQTSYGHSFESIEEAMAYTDRRWPYIPMEECETCGGTYTPGDEHSCNTSTIPAAYGLVVCGCGDVFTAEDPEETRCPGCLGNIAPTEKLRLLFADPEVLTVSINECERCDTIWTGLPSKLCPTCAGGRRFQLMLEDE